MPCTASQACSRAGCAATAPDKARHGGAQLGAAATRSRRGARAEEEHAALMQKVDQLNLLRESNAALRCGPTLALTAERALLLPLPVPRDVTSRAARAAPWRARRRWPRPKEAAACAAPCHDGARAARADDEIEIRTLVSFHGKSGAQYILDITPLNEVRTGGKAAGQIFFMFLLPAGVVTGSSSCVTADTTPPAAGPRNCPAIVVLLSQPSCAMASAGLAGCRPGAW